jgi:ribulose-5-phosphate 4-epimerase/fuculose-1-phosphate aldolase
MKDQEGYIKFKYEWEKKLFTFPRELFERLNEWREKFFQMNLIGVLDSGIGFGNVSIRVDDTNQFIITGSATGKCKNLNRLHYSFVEDFNIEENFVKCIGETKCSSESLTHAAVYTHAPEINAIVHTHNSIMWNLFKDKKPTTSARALFGTPEIAKEMGELVKQKQVLEEQIVVMGGHEDGLITFGSNLEEAGQAMLRYLDLAEKQNN